MYLNRAHNLREEYIRRQNSQLNESFYQRNLTFLLEQDDGKKASKFFGDVTQAADEAENEINSLAAKLPPQMANTKAALERAKAEIVSNRLKKGSLRDMIGTPYQELTKILANSQGLSSSIGSAFQTVVSSLSGLSDQLKDDDERKNDLGTILATYAGVEGSKLPTQDDFETAIKNSLKPTKGITGGIGQGLKGFLGKISSLWGGGGGADIGFGLSKEDFLGDMMDMPVVELDKFLKGAGGSLEDVTTGGASDPVQLASSALEDVDIALTPEGEPVADETAPEALEGEPEGQKLTDILKAMGVDEGEATEIVATLKDLSAEELSGALPDEPEDPEAKQAYDELSSSLEDKVATFFEHANMGSSSLVEGKYDEDFLIRSAWARMAGIE